METGKMPVLRQIACLTEFFFPSLFATVNSWLRVNWLRVEGHQICRRTPWRVFPLSVFSVPRCLCGCQLVDG